MASVTERVRAGAMLLDSTIPDWAGQINTTKLDMVTCWGCVIGQLFSDEFEGFDDGTDDENEYTFGCDQLGIGWGPRSEAVSLGFHADESRTENECRQLSGAERKEHYARLSAEYAALRAAWLAEIDARLAPIDETLLSPIDTEACPL